MGVRRIENLHHPRGYRELRSNAEMRKLMNQKIALQQGKCAIWARNSRIAVMRLRIISVRSA
jgi:hypothetical protein